MFLFIDLSFHPLLEVNLPTAYIGKEENGHLSFEKKATEEVLKSLEFFVLSEAEKSALDIINSLQPNILYNKYTKKGETFEKLYQNKNTKKIIQEQIEGKTNVKPNAKTGVAYGLIYSRDSGNIKVVNRDEQENIGNKINFKFYIGTNRRGKFNCILSPNSIYEKFEFFGVLKTDVFEFYYTTSSEANTNEMPISEAKIKRINLKNEYRLEDRYRIYFKITEVETLEYVIVENEDGIEIKEFIEEGTITLN